MLQEDKALFCGDLSQAQGVDYARADNGHLPVRRETRDVIRR